MAGPTVSVPSAVTRAIEPPPAPIVWMSIIGTCSGQVPIRPSTGTSASPPPAPIVWMRITGTRGGHWPIRPSTVTSASPPRTRHTSALVPPTSTEMRSAKPAASPIRRAPIPPAAGPASAVWGLQDVGAEDASVRFHDRQRRVHAPAAQPFGKPPDVASHERLDVGIEYGAHRALELAEDRQHLARQRHRAARMLGED